MLSRLCMKWVSPIVSQGVVSIHTSCSMEAARKGTRMKREAKKRAMKSKKIEIAKKEFLPKKRRFEMEKLKMEKTAAERTEVPIDDVYITAKYKKPVLPFSEALMYHRQMMHPSAYNQPEALVYASMELALKLDRKNKYIAEFSGISDVPCKFETGEEDRTILVISEDTSLFEELRSLGVETIVGRELSKLIKTDKILINDYTHIIADIQLIVDLMPLKVLLKGKFPDVSLGTATVDVVAAVKRFTTGIEYSMMKNKYDPNIGVIDVKIGQLNMSDEELQENFKTLCNEISARQPRTRTKSMIEKVRLTCPPSKEDPLIDTSLFILPKEKVALKK